jgi:hypothetical protein
MVVRGRGHKLAMTAVGLATAATPFLIGQEVAGAAQTTASADGSLTFARQSDNAEVTCRAILSALHNTDDPDHPYVLVTETFGYTTGHERECFDDTFVTLTVTYRDANGRTQTTESRAGPGSLRVGGAKSNVSVRMDTYYSDCDADVSESCDNIVTASPK